MSKYILYNGCIALKYEMRAENSVSWCEVVSSKLSFLVTLCDAAILSSYMSCTRTGATTLTYSGASSCCRL